MKPLAIASVLVSALGSAAPLSAQAIDAASTGRTLVMPFENVTRDSRIVWLGEAAAVLLADDLNALGVNAIARDERRAAFEELQVPRTAALSDATVIRIGQLVGASRVIVGTLQLESDTLVVRARSIGLDAGRMESDITERGAVPDLFAIFEGMAARIAGRGSSGGGPRAHPSVAAFENYIKGLLAETPATALTYLNAALRADPGFDRARLALWTVYDEQTENDRALAAVLAVPAVSELSRRARFMAALSQVKLRRYEDGFATFKALADEWPTASVLNNLGVVQLRRGASPQLGLPTYYFNKAVEADPTEPDYFFNLGYAYWIERDVPASVYWLREALRRNPADGEAHFVLGAALTASGSLAEAGREKELARRLSSTFAEWEKRPGADAVPKGLERLKRDVELPRARSIEESIAASGQRDQEELARFYLDRAGRLYQEERDREAMTELARTLYLSPYQAQAHLLVGRINLRAGRVHDAIDSLKISLWSAETAEAHAVLADALIDAGDQPGARTELDRALALDPASPEARRVLARLPPK